MANSNLCELCNLEGHSPRIHKVVLHEGSQSTRSSESFTADLFILFVLFQSRQGKKLAILAVAASSGRKKDKLYKIYRPNLGLSPKMESLVDLKKKYKKVN